MFRALHHLSGPMPKTSDDARIQQILATDVFEHVAELRRDRTSNSSSEDSAKLCQTLRSSQRFVSRARKMSGPMPYDIGAGFHSAVS